MLIFCVWNSSATSVSLLCTIVKSIRDFVKEDLSVQFVHSSREGNRSTNYLVKFGLNYGMIISRVDRLSLDLLVTDALSVSILRV